MPWTGGDDIERVVRVIDVERFTLLTRNADRIRDLYAVFGEGAEFHSSDVVRIYNALGAGSDIPSNGSLSNYLVTDERGGLLEKLGSGRWRVLRVAPSAPALDIERLVQSIDVERFGALPTQAARYREICRAFGVGTEFRLQDLMRACGVLGCEVDACRRSSAPKRLRDEAKKGRLEVVRRGVWRVLRVEEQPTRFDVEGLVQAIDVERFLLLSTQAARVRAIYAALGEGAEFCSDDVMRAYEALGCGVGTLSKPSVSKWLRRDTKGGLLEVVERGVWRVLRAEEPLPRFDVEGLVQSIGVERFASLPTQAARLRAIWAAFGEGAKFRSGDVVRVYDALGSGFDTPNSRSLSSYLTTDMKGGLLEKLGVEVWRVLRIEPDVQALDIECLVQSIDVERFSELPTHAARIRAIHSAFDEGLEFRVSDVVRAYRALDAGIDAPGFSTISRQLIQDTKTGLLTKLARGLWQVLDAPDEPPALDVASLVQSIDVEQFSELPTHTARLRAIYAALGEGAEFCSDDVMRAYEALGCGVGTLSKPSVSKWLRRDTKGGLLEVVERGVWRVLRAEEPLPRLDVEGLARAIDVERFTSLPTQAARIRAICAALGEGTGFRASDVVRVYDALSAGVDAPDSRSLSSYLAKDAREGLLEKLGVNVWRVLRVKPGAPHLDVERLVQRIDLEQFESMSTLVARCREICRAFGEGTEFRRADMVRAYEALGCDVDERMKASISTQLHHAANQGMLDMVRYGVWRVLHVEPQLERQEPLELEDIPARTSAVDGEVFDELLVEEFGLAEYLIPDY